MINERIIKEVGNVFYARAVGTVIGAGIFYAADAVVSGAISVGVCGFITGVIVGGAIRNDIISSNTAFLISYSILGTIIGLENFSYELGFGITCAGITSTGIASCMVGARIFSAITGDVADIDNNAEAQAIHVSNFLIGYGAAARSIGNAVLSKLKADIVDYINSNDDPVLGLNDIDAANDTAGAF